MSTFYCKTCDNNSLSAPFGNDTCDDCWEKDKKKKNKNIMNQELLNEAYEAGENDTITEDQLTQGALLYVENLEVKLSDEDSEKLITEYRRGFIGTTTPDTPDNNITFEMHNNSCDGKLYAMDNQVHSGVVKDGVFFITQKDETDGIYTDIKCEKCGANIFDIDITHNF